MAAGTAGSGSQAACASMNGAAGTGNSNWSSRRRYTRHRKLPLGELERCGG